MLIEGRDLVNGHTIVQPDDTDHVEYFHIELDSHDVIIAEGALSETFVDDDSRGMFHNAAEYRALYPDETAAPALYYAPRCSDGYAVEAARRKIAQRGGLRSGLADDGGGKLRGYVDVISPARIDGWAQNEDHPEAPVCLDIIVDGVCVDRVLANRYRQDLLDAGLGSGHHSFSYVVKPDRPIGSGVVEIRRSLDGMLLPATARCRQASNDSVKVDRSTIMRRAWAIHRDRCHTLVGEPRHQLFAACLRQAWAESGRTMRAGGYRRTEHGLLAAA